MRNNQITLNIKRLNSEVPKYYPKDKMEVQIYAGSDNLYAALGEAFSEAINIMKEWEYVAIKCDVITNVDGDP